MSEERKDEQNSGKTQDSPKESELYLVPILMY